MGAKSFPALLLLTVSITVLAAPLAAARDLLYVGEAAHTPGTGDRELVLRALEQVLVRLTGRIDEPLVEGLGISGVQAERLLLARQFRNAERPAEDGGVIRERRLRAEFDPAGVNAIVDQAGWARWGSERPQVLLWMVSDRDGAAEFVDPDPVLQWALDEAEFRHGLSFVLPILDALDLAEVQPGDVRGGFVDTAAVAARRYRADVVAMVDLRQMGDFWTGRWFWQLGRDDRSFERSADSRAAAIEEGIDRIAGALASRFATVAGEGAEALRLQIAGIANPVQYAEVLGYLESLSVVRRVRVREARGEVVEFELAVTTSGLEDILALSDLLAFERRDLHSGTLHYQLAW